jgi:hypothetical protein
VISEPARAYLTDLARDPRGLGNHSFRATGITADLKNDGGLSTPGEGEPCLDADDTTL